MFDPEDFVRRCRQAITEPDPALAVRDVVAETISGTEGLQASLAGAGPRPITWYQSPELTVQHIFWPNGVITPPHEHRMWAVIGVYQGQEDNTFWRRTANRVEQVGGREVRAGEVLLLGGDAVHAVANPCRYPTLGLHVYGGDIVTTPRSEWDFAGENEHVFDIADVEQVIAAMMSKAQQIGRDLDFEEIRHACLTTYRQPRSLADSTPLATNQPVGSQ